MGYLTAIQQVTGDISTANGTSLSAPLISGLVACLWQAFPSGTANEIYSNMVRSASQYNNPTPNLGFGIPNFEMALNALPDQPDNSRKLSIFPNPSNGNLTIRVPWQNGNDIYLSLWDISGKQIIGEKVDSSNNFITLNLTDFFPSGLYFVRLSQGADYYTGKFVKTSL
jgi:subtilisin family serine protease